MMYFTAPVLVALTVFFQLAAVTADTYNCPAITGYTLKESSTVMLVLICKYDKNEASAKATCKYARINVSHSFDLLDPSDH